MPPASSNKNQFQPKLRIGRSLVEPCDSSEHTPAQFGMNRMLSRDVFLHRLVLCASDSTKRHSFRLESQALRLQLPALARDLCWRLSVRSYVGLKESLPFALAAATPRRIQHRE